MEMYKKLLGFTSILLGALFAIPVMVNAASIEPEVVSYENHDEVFANGVPITVTKGDAEGTTKITWDGGIATVKEKVRIFGGGKEGTSYPSSNITIDGATISTVFGGGYGKENASSHVGVTNVTIKNATVTNSIFGGGLFYATVGTANLTVENTIFTKTDWAGINGGGASYDNDLGKDAGTKANPTNNVTDNVVMYVKNITTESKGVVYGGSQGYGTVKNVSIVIDGENTKIPYLTTAGSNGATLEGTMEVKNGNINVLQSVNSGTIEKSTVTVTGGTITNLYVGGESGTGGVSGIVKESNVNVLGGTVTNLSSGNNDSVEITDTTTGITTNVAIVEGTVNNNVASLPTEVKELAKNSITITSNNGVVTLTANETGVEGAVVKFNVTPNAGYDFTKVIVKDADGNEITVADNSFVMPNSPVTLEAIFTKQIANPDTGDSIVIALGTLLVGALGAGFVGLKLRKQN